MRLAAGGIPRVEAEERWLAEIRRGRAFALGEQLSATAGVYSVIQLVNPAGSGVVIIIRSILVSGPTAVRISVRNFNTLLGTLVGTGVNQLIGGAAGAGEVRREGRATIVGTHMVAGHLGANTQIQPVADWFAELDPGEAIVVTAHTVNVTLEAAYQWIEIT